MSFPRRPNAMVFRTMRDPYPHPKWDEGVGILVLLGDEPHVWYNTHEARNKPQMFPEYAKIEEGIDIALQRAADYADQGRRVVCHIEILDTTLAIVFEDDTDEVPWEEAHPEAIRRFRERMKEMFDVG